MRIRLIAAIALVFAASVALTNVAGAKTTVQQVRLVVKTDSQHAKKGPDGKWHDAFLPADFTVKAGEKVDVTVVNYDTSPHSFSSSTLRVNELIKAAKGSKPGTTTFSFTAPKKSGNYSWWCDMPCDQWAMEHNGYMRGVVTVHA